MKKIILLLILMVGIGSLMALTIEDTDTHGFIASSWSGVTLQVDQYDETVWPYPFGLTWVDVYLDYEAISTGSATNNETTSSNINVGQNATLTADIPDNEIQADKSLLATAESGLLAYAGSQVRTFSDTGTNPALTGSATQVHWSYDYSYSPHKAIVDDYFIGSGTYDVLTATSTQNIFNGDGQASVDVRIALASTSKVTLKVVYTYTTDETPVTLSSFTAMYLTEGAQLQWTTQSESNNMGWNIYRSTTGDAEEAAQLNVGLIEGAGTVTEPTDYMFTDSDDLMTNQTYFYWIEDVTYGNVTTLHGPVSVQVTEQGSTPDSPEIADQVMISNYPNPFNPSTSLYYSLKDNEVAESIEIYNVRGQKVRSFDAPVNPQQWDGKDMSGTGVSSGIYMYVLKTSQNNYVKKMVLSK